MPSTSTRGRVARADEKKYSDQEAESEELNSLKTSSGPPSDNVTQEQESGNGGSSIGGSSPSVRSGSGGRRGHNSDDMDGLSSGNDSGERERDNRSHGRQSIRSSHNSSNGKDSGLMLETTESNKR